jgi:hypothetical protein
MSHHVKNLLLALTLALVLSACSKTDENILNQPAVSSHQAISESGNSELVQAFEAKKTDVQVSGHGIVIKLLKDDNKGARHQKFLVKINAEQTLLFAHNIDLAPRVPLALGDTISFYGEYVYNPKGGIMHWTHHAPQGDHVAGWILHHGKKYE